MKLWDAYDKVNGNTGKLADLFHDGKIDTVIEKISVFIKFLNRKNSKVPPLLVAYSGYGKYCSEMFACISYYNKLTDEVNEYFETFTVQELIRIYQYDYFPQEIEEVLSHRVIKNLDILDSVRNRKLKSVLISRAMFSVDLDLLSPKTKGIIPPVTLPVSGEKLMERIDWYFKWIKSEAPEENHVKYLMCWKEHIDDLLDIARKYFSCRTLLIAFSVNWISMSVYRPLVNLVFDKMSMQEFLETIYEADEKYPGVNTKELQSMYFQIRGYSDI